MATLVLTAVGSVIGGPIGGAIGAAIGQSIDRNVLFKPKGRQGPRLTELAVQTSSYGRQIPQLFGSMRIAGTVIWATDLVEAASTHGGGKGRPSVTSYSYSASFAVALSSRPILGVGRVWADGSLLRGAAGDWKVPATFRLHLGGEEQAADPLIASAEGAGLTPAHRGLAYAVFEGLPLEEFGNRIPSLTFEVFADAGPVSVGAIAEAVGDGAVLGGGAALPVAGFSAYGDGARGVIETLAEVSGAWFAPVAGGLAMRDAPAVVTAVADDGVGAARGSRRVRPIETVPRTLSIAHYDPARDYQTGVQRVRRSGAGTREEEVEAPVAIGAVQAKAIATAMLARAEAARTTRRVATDLSALAIAPGEGVTIAGEPGLWRVTQAALEAMAVTLELMPIGPAAVPASGASGGRVLGAPDLLTGETVLAVFETPPLDEALLTRPRVTIVAAGTAAGWRRAVLSYSLDGGASWIAAGGTAPTGVIGTVAVTPELAAATLIDRRSAIEIELLHDDMALGDADAAALDRGANLALVGGELLQFARATPIAPRQWRLEGLLRARRGTVAAHVVGERFVLLEPGRAVTIDLDAAVGSTVRLMASGAGDDEAVVAALTLSGASILPPAPIRMTGRDTPAGEATIGWRRRSRAGWRWHDGADAPLAEEGEAYRVTITPTGGAARTIETGTASVTVTATERSGGPVTVSVRQRGTNGLSPAATLTI